MPSYNVDSDRTETTAAGMQNDFNDLMTKLTKVQKDVDALIADGYSTPSAEKEFRPFFDEFAKGYDSVAHGLEGIGKYVKAVGDAFHTTDESLGKSLSGS